MRNILNMKCIIVLAVWSLCHTAIHADGYTTKRLAHIDALLATKKVKHDISRRTNQYGEVEHIGLKLFSDAVRQLKPSPSYDFLERQLLEMNIYNEEERDRLAMQYSFTISAGSAYTAMDIDSTYSYTEEELEYHRFMSTWSKDGKNVLQIIYPKNWQLLSGCDITELESIFEKQMKRHKMSPASPLPIEGSWIVTPQMSNTLYLNNGLSDKGDNGQREYVRSAKQITHTVRNIMIADDMEHNIEMQLCVSRYGFRNDTINIPLRQFINYCRTVENCTPFFGIKQRNGKSTDGLLMLANKNGGFIHMVSVTIDDQVAADGKGTIYGKLLPYIPIYNIKKEYLNLEEHESSIQQ